MTLEKPRDYRSLNQFFMLKEMIGEANAIIVVDCLWTQLGYQLEIHGGSGFFKASEVPAFVASIPCNIPNLMEKLEVSQWLTIRGDNWECPLFFYYNAKLDKNYIPKLGGKYNTFAKGLKSIKRASPMLVAELPQELWIGPNNERILPNVMNEMVMVIKTLDSVLALGRRELKEYTLPLIHAAWRVVNRYSGDKLTVIMRRLYLKKSTQGVPRSAELCLEKFDDVVALIMPDEGYVNWMRSERIAEPT